ncbi:MAG: succinate dehydrogenase assembly factor 2, partial [Methylococcales bacterium]
ILTRFLDHRYEASSASEQRLFETLLGFPDPELQRLLIGGEDQNDSDLLKLVRSIRSAARNIA